MVVKEENTEKRNRILNLAKDWFIQSGYKSVKTDDLANELGISKRTIYEMFPSKDDLLIEALKLPIIEFERNMNELAIKVVEDEHFSFFENLNKMWQLIIEHASIFSSKFDSEIKKYLPQFYSACQVHTNKRFDNFRKVFELGIERGFIKKEINVDVFMSIMHYSMSNVLRYENLANIPLKVNEIIRQIFVIAFTGAMTPLGAEKFNQKIENNFDNVY